MNITKKTLLTVSCCGEPQTFYREDYPDKKSINLRCPKCRKTQTVIFDESIFNSLQEPDRSICLRYFQKRESVTDISKAIGKCRSYIWYHITKAGFGCRSISEGKKIEWKRRKKR